MMNPMQQEMQRDRHPVIRQIKVQVEQEPMERIFQDGPYETT
jgi:hypothetical protein